MDQDTLASSHSSLDVLADLFEMRLEVCGAHVHDVDFVGMETGFFGEGVPRRVEDLYEVRDIGAGEIFGLVKGGHGAQVESTCRSGRGWCRGENEVHGRTHGLLNGQRHRVEADHD